MLRDTCLVFLVLAVRALAERSVLERAREIGASFQVLPNTVADAESTEPNWSEDTKEDDRVADAYWDLEDKLFFSKEKRDVAAGTHDLVKPRPLDLPKSRINQLRNGRVAPGWICCRH